MILDEYVKVRVNYKNLSYYRSFGINNTGYITLKVNLLPKNAIVKINCKCDICESNFKRSFAKIIDKQIHFCISCNRKNIYQKMNKEKLFEYRKSIFGANNPNWKPTTREYKRYQKLVYKLSEINYKKYCHIINPNNHKRALCGVANGYQLDHIISIKEGFDKKINPEIIADINNLQLLTWQENNSKRNKEKCHSF